VLRRGRRARGSGSSSALYINSLANGCGLATNYKAVSHPSLPSYIAATSGDTWGIADGNPPSSHPLAVNSVFQQAGSAGSYQESMPKFSFVTPNLCNDMHDCSIATGDAWLQSWVPKITATLPTRPAAPC
jgi:phosphatidylinositol-3-phosphatase